MFLIIVEDNFIKIKLKGEVVVGWLSIDLELRIIEELYSIE